MYETLKEYRNLLKNIYSLTTLQFVILVIPVFLVPYFVKVIGLEKYGLIAYSGAIVNFINILTDYGFNLSATARVSESRTQLSEINNIFTNVLLIKVILLVISLFFIVIVTLFTDLSIEQKFIIYANLGVCLAQVLIPTWLFHGLEKMKVLLFINLVYRTCMVILILILVKKATDYWLIPVIYTATSLLGATISLLYIKKNLKIRLLKVNLHDALCLLRDSTIFFFSKLATTSYTSLITIMLGALTNFEQVGIYSAAEKVLQAAKAIFTPITQAIYPYLVRLTTSDIKKSISFLKFLLLFTIMFTSVIGIVMYTFSYQIAEFLFWDNEVENISQISTTIRIFSFIPVLVGISNVFGVQLLIPRGYQNLFAVILGTSGFIGITLCFHLITIMGFFGAASSVVITEMIIVIIMSYVVIKQRLLSDNNYLTHGY